MKKIFTLLLVLTAALSIQAQDKWAIAGDAAVMGENWNEKTTTNVMTLGENGQYTLTKEKIMLKANTYYFKAVKNDSWDDAIGKVVFNEEKQKDEVVNQSLTIAEDGEYTVKFILNLTENTVSAEATKTGEYQGQSTVVLAGATAIFGKSWDAAASENMMTTTDGVHYTLQKTDITLEAFTPLDFKIIVDGQWNGNAGDGHFGSKQADGKTDWPNIQIEVEENGVYTINFSVDIEAKTFAVQTTKTADAVIAEKTWTVAGSSALVFGEDHTWDPTCADNDMTKQDDGSFELVKHSITFDDPTTINFKVCANHSWDESYGDNGENMSFEIETAGTYDVIFTFIPDSKSVSAELADPTPAPDADGIENVKSNVKANAAIFNLQGQRVSANFRGIAIQNGRKVVMK